MKVGQKALINVFACPYPDSGTLSGYISVVSPDYLQSQDNNTQISRYEVTIQPVSPSFSLGTKKCTIQTGMEGRAEILTD